MEVEDVGNDGGDHVAHGASACAEDNPDLFYRLKLKLWNRDRMTNVIRTPYDKSSAHSSDVAHWSMGTRVVVTEEGDTHTGKYGRIVEYRGKGWYAVLLEDGHKATFSPMQWERMADQSGHRYPPPSVEAYRAAHRAIEMAEGKKLGRDSSSSPAQFGTPGPEGRVRGVESGAGTPTAASQSNPPPGTRVRIIRTYGGQLLPKEEVRTGETQTFAHGWYYITLDDSGKKESCRRNSFVVVGDEEDIALGFYDGTATEGVRSSRKNGHDASTAAEGDGGGRSKDGEEEGEREPVRTYTGKKRGRKPKEQRVEESESDEDESEDEENEERKKGKRQKQEEEARVKREKEEVRRRREQEQEEREREKQREKEREQERLRAEEAEREANMTQEERDALEAARLAAMLNRNPRRRGGGDVATPGLLPRIPLKKPKEKKLMMIDKGKDKEGEDAH